MRFEDEQYVKIYKRDTATWKAMNWQGRAILSLLVRKADGAGLMETSSLGRVEGVSALIEIPPEVVAAGLDSLLKLKVVQWLKGDVLLLPRYVEAQEARKTESAKKRGQRETARDAARAQELGILEDVSHDVPSCPAVSQPVPLQIIPAQHSPDQISSISLPDGTDQPSLIDDDPRKERSPRAQSQWEKIWERMCADRRERLGDVLEMDPEEVQDEPVTPALLNQALKRLYDKLSALDDGGVSEPMSLRLVWAQYLLSDFGAGTDPSYCFKGFISDKTIMRFHEAHLKALDAEEATPQ